MGINASASPPDKVVIVDKATSTDVSKSGEEHKDVNGPKKARSNNDETDITAYIPIYKSFADDPVAVAIHDETKDKGHSSLVGQPPDTKT